MLGLIHRAAKIPRDISAKELVELAGQKRWSLDRHVAIIICPATTYDHARRRKRQIVKKRAAAWFVRLLRNSRNGTV